MAAENETIKKTEILKSFQWKIQNFTAFARSRENKTLISPPFAAQESRSLQNSHWEIKLQVPATKVGNANADYLQFYLELKEELSEINPGVKVKVQFCLLDAFYRELYTSRSLEGTIGGPDGQPGKFEILNAFFRNELIHTNHYVQNDTLLVKVKLWINETVSPTKNQLGAEHSDQNDFSQWLDSPELSDVSIVTDDLNFKAHKIVLSARSPVFAAMFRNTMSESLTNTVTIKEFSSGTVREMIRFIYGGSVEVSKEDYKELLKIAEKYELELLKSECIKTAIKEMTAENVFELLILGDMYNSPELKSKAMHFINSSKGNSLFSVGNENGDFKKFAQEYPDLLLEMYENVRNNSARANYSEESNGSVVIEEITGFTTIFKMD